jgi:hypothetical protein
LWYVGVELRVHLRLQDVLNAELRLFLGLEALRIVQHFAVAVADVRRVPAGHAGIRANIGGDTVLSMSGRS